ncbi:hypothetical protein [Microbacterium sp. WCS2018Hpa-23]|uniref:hypothetical protein n=2 Tax=unclassified Microbacterium TaxID=2609290 RepID=UPI0028834A5B|nr:hypothetical protein [Microbacterium sp. WCS2018Hpa-23]
MPLGQLAAPLMLVGGMILSLVGFHIGVQIGGLQGGVFGALIGAGSAIVILVLATIVTALVEFANEAKRARSTIRINGSVLDLSWNTITGRRVTQSVDMDQVRSISVAELGVRSSNRVLHFYGEEGRRGAKHIGWTTSRRLSHADEDVRRLIEPFVSTPNELHPKSPSAVLSS